MEEKVLLYNKIAMNSLNSNDYHTTYEYLTKAQRLLKGFSIDTCGQLMGITLNNVGCYYKSIGEIEKARMHFGQAIEIGKASPIDRNLAATYLNMSAIESQTGQHLKSLESSLKAIHLLKNSFKDSLKSTMSFVSAHYNAGVQYKHLQRYSESKKIAEIGLDICCDLLGNEHFLAAKLRSLLSVEKTVKVHSRKFQLTPLKNIITSTVDNSSRRRYNKLSNSPDTARKRLEKFSVDSNSPLMFSRKLQKITGEKTADSMFFKLLMKKNVGKKDKRSKSCAKKSNVHVQVDLNLNMLKDGSSLRERSAVVIQKNWKMYIARKKYKERYLDMKIDKAKVDADKAYENLEKLQSLKLKLQGKVVRRVNELVPVPFKMKINRRNADYKNRNYRAIRKRSMQRGLEKSIAHVIKIQSCFRKYLASKAFKIIKEKMRIFEMFVAPINI